MKKLSLLISLYFFITPVQAQDSSACSKKISLQYAGSIGYHSIGISYHLPKIKSDVSFHFGYVPKNQGGQLHIGAIKYVFQPVRIRMGNTVTFYPINPGLFLSYHFGNDYHLLWPKDQYPSGYYWWSSGLREHLSLSTELKIKMKHADKNAIKGISVYTEINTNDLYLYSYFANPDYFTLDKIVKIGFGMFLYL
jgi:hypothetical protein